MNEAPWTFRWMKDNGGGHLVVGPWAVRLCWPWYPGRFSNGSRWHSRVGRWRDDDWFGDAR